MRTGTGRNARIEWARMWIVEDVLPIEGTIFHDP